MKLKLLLAAAILTSVIVGCKYDDDALWNKVNSLDQRVTNLETTQAQMNKDISAMSKIVDALNGNVYVTSVEQTANGYVIKFSNGSSATIANGKDGASGVSPRIGDDGNWWIGDTNTGVKAAGTNGINGSNGLTPHIGVDGNWWIGDTNTGVKASGTTGATGANGITPHIGEDGNWWIGDTNTGVKAAGTAGANGQTPRIGDDGNWWIGNNNTGVKATGADGVNGITPRIGDDGNWWIGNTNTGVKAAGTDGAAGAAGQTPRIGEDGNWWIGNTNTGVKAAGEDAVAANVPIIGVQEVDGVYYWTLTTNTTTEFLTDNRGRMLPVTGYYAVTPIIKVNTDGYWAISFDRGVTYELILDDNNNPVPANGSTTDSFFRSVEVSGGYLIVVLYDGQVVSIPLQDMKDYIDSGIPYESKPNPSPGTTNTELPSGATFEAMMLNGVPVVRVSMPGIQNPAGGWLVLSGTSKSDQNTWLELDDEPRGIIIEPIDGENSMQADIVFTVDNSGSMSEEANAVARDIIEWANYLTNSGLDVRFGCVGYSEYGSINGAIDMTSSEELSTYLNRSSGTSRTMGFSGDNSSTLQSKAASYRVSDECGAMAIRYADTNFTFRPGVNRFYVNFTDEANQPNGNSEYSVEFFKTTSNWPSGRGTVYTVYSGSTSYSWTNNYTEQPWLISTYTGGSSFTTNSSFSGVNLKDLPVTGAMTNSNYIYFTDVRNKFDGNMHKVKVTVLSPDGTVRGERLYSKTLESY